MNLGRCPICHSRLHLDALVQDEAGRELLAILAGLDEATGRALVGYLGLFRPPSRDLANDRAARLAREALALAEGQPAGALATAMQETVATLRARDGGPLTSHGYLKRVLASRAESGLIPSQPTPATNGMAGNAGHAILRRSGSPSTATGMGIAKLQGLKRRED